MLRIVLITGFIWTSSLTVQAQEVTHEVSPPYQNYKDGYAEATQTRKVLIVQISSKHCPPCEQQRADVERNAAAFPRDQAVIVYVDRDKEPTLARKLIKGRFIPETRYFWREGSTWRDVTTPGRQTFSQIRQCLRSILRR